MVRKEKGTEERKQPPATRVKAGLFKEGLVFVLGIFLSSNPYCRAQKEEYVGTERMGRGALLHS